MNDKISRRSFAKRTGATAVAMTAASYQRVLGANERINLAQIGCGSRGFGAHMNGIHKHDKDQNVQYIAVCDPWKLHREQAAQAVKDWYGIEARQFESYQDLLALKDVDAVMIASCDHHHTTHLEAVALAGKDVYVEKPIGLELDRVKRACDAVKEKNLVCQVGTQLRADPRFGGAKETYATGILGTVSRIEQRRNSTRPYWYSWMEKHIDQIKKEDVNWDEFQMDRKSGPFDPVRYTGWYGFRNYTDGPLANLGCHFIDLVHYITGAGFPLNCVANGGQFIWKDDYNFSCPDHVQALWVYPEGFMVSYSTNFGNDADKTYLRIHGDQGLLREESGKVLLTAEGGFKNRGVIRGETAVNTVERPDHFLDWLQCLRTRQQPLAPIDAGYQHTVACLMAVQSYDTGKRMTYDTEKREILPG